MFEKIHKAYELLSSVQLQATETGIPWYLLCTCDENNYDKV